MPEPAADPGGGVGRHARGPSLFSNRGHVTIAMGITGVMQRLTRGRVAKCAARLKAAAAILSEALGHRPSA